LNNLQLVERVRRHFVLAGSAKTRERVRMEEASRTSSRGRGGSGGIRTGREIVGGPKTDTNKRRNLMGKCKVGWARNVRLPVYILTNTK
jgi:hypothetical protein